MAWNWDDDAGEYLWTDEVYVPNVGGIDDGGFNPADLKEAEKITLGSDIYYRNADGSYTGTNTETGESFGVTAGQMSSLITPEKTGNASMADLKGEAYIAKLNDPNWVNSINKMFGSNLTKNDLLKIAAVTGGGIAGLSSLNQPNIKKVGYQGGLKDLVAQRTMATAPVAGRRPGAGGTNYGGDVQYTERAANAAAPAAPVQTVRADTTAGGNPWAGKMKRGFAAPIAAETAPAATPPASSIMTPDLMEQIRALSARNPKAAKPTGNGDEGAGFTKPVMSIPETGTGFYEQFNKLGIGKPADTDITTGNGGEGPGFDSPLVALPDPVDIYDNRMAPTYNGKPADTSIPNQPDTYGPGNMEYTDADYARDQAMRANNPDFHANKNAGMAQMAAQAAAQTVKAAHGGLMGLAHGGRYLQGNTDGMADKLRTSIDGKQPAALSHGEFVIPADVVSHLGNGNSDAGAKKLYSMMDKIRQARTGTKKQGKKINPDKFMPGGLAAAYAAGGSVMGFAGEAGSYVPSGTTGVDQTLATWTGTYVPDMLSETTALTKTPTPQYTGPLTAGASDLQNQAFAGASENALAGYDPTKFTSQTFGTPQAQQYMNPFVQTALNPQLEEARRQSQITQQMNNAQMTKAGAFGGSASGIMNRETQRSLGSNLANITGKGYETAYDKAMAQFNADQNRGLDTQKASEQSRQYGADYGRSSIKDLADLGATQRGIEAEGIAADKKAFEEVRDDPYNKLKFKSQMLNGLPIQATNYASALPSVLSEIASGAVTVDQAMKRLGLS